MKRLIVFVLAVCCTATAWAGPGRAGLWESTIEFGGAATNAPPPNLPPNVVAMMKARGIELGAHKITTQTCVTPEMAARDTPVMPTRAEQKCQTQNVKKSGTSFSADIVCNSDTMKGNGTVKMSFPSSKEYTGEMSFTGVGHDNQPVSTKSNMTGRWLADDCGTVKPPPGQ